ncbi:MAG TPA: hypothetical protein EYN27_04515 [Rhodospirillales bacterium]|nr:hypothetical protein [Rhodospirillales bacterium]
MSDDNVIGFELSSDPDEPMSTEPEDLKPKKPSNRAPEGIRTFTVCRQGDETGVSGEGVVIEGATFATGHTVIHWLTPAPRGSIAFFDAFDDFLKIHIKPHPTNRTIITFEDGEQTTYDGG